MYCGVDVSGNTIDVCIQKEDNTFESLTYSNDKIGFKSLLQVTNKSHHFVMESTGVYHMALCFYLHERKCHYSVVNALKIKRYIQMNLERNKSDKKTQDIFASMVLTKHLSNIKCLIVFTLSAEP